MTNPHLCTWYLPFAFLSQILMSDALKGHELKIESNDSVTDDHTRLTFKGWLEVNVRQSESTIFRSLGRHVTSHDLGLPFQQFLSELDKNMRSLDHQWNDGCTSRFLPDDQAANRPFIYHTGMFLTDRALHGWQGVEQKLALSLLSALMTQPNAKIYYWIDVDPNSEPIHSVMKPILQKSDFAKRVHIKVFDPEKEFSEALPEAAAKHVVQMYKSDSMLSSRSDLQRYAVLNNYGGLWGDGDVLMVHDVSPALGVENFAYLGQGDFINGAILWASKPKSPFMSACLAAVAARAAVNANVYQFGPTLLGELHKTLKKGSFHIMPTCFFDGAWSGVPNSVHWDDFFSKTATDGQLAYLDSWNDQVTPFAYHWHGRWERPIVKGSVADRLYAIYTHKLESL
eukprot:TRINITY_DN97002_c0_g1_i1.p1 TRINITY_DN97002_c0_g1~~TRINITY_DN97002_c0_g1_i1.p1  ORF type:complete len:398 (-),score=51.32 TRINITY_DN97002_c0_g1_i1:43-1236(-)